MYFKFSWLRIFFLWAFQSSSSATNKSCWLLMLFKSPEVIHYLYDMDTMPLLATASNEFLHLLCICTYTNPSIRLSSLTTEWWWPWYIIGNQSRYLNYLILCVWVPCIFGTSFWNCFLIANESYMRWILLWSQMEVEYLDLEILESRNWYTSWKTRYLCCCSRYLTPEGIYHTCRFALKSYQRVTFLKCNDSCFIYIMY